MTIFKRLPSPTLSLFVAAAFVLCLGGPTRSAARSEIEGAVSPYRTVSPSRNGTGIVYLGRETARVMGHEGADWLERPERQAEERPDLLLKALALRPGMQVADVGAGTGYYSWRMAQAVGPSGRVLAVDVQPEMLTRLDAEMKRRQTANVVGVLGTTSDPRLPAASLDLVLMVDVYHEFDHPREMLQGLVRALKPDGRIAFVEYRLEDPSVPILPLHKMSEAQVRREAEAAGLTWIETARSLPWQHVILFRRAR